MTADDVRKPTLEEQIEAVDAAIHAVSIEPRQQQYVEREHRLRAAAATLREMQKQRTPYPEFCRHPDKCEGLGCCPRDPTCAD